MNLHYFDGKLRAYTLILVSVTLFALTACESVPVLPVTPQDITPTIINPVTLPVEVFVRPDQYNNLITLQIGQILTIEPPSWEMKWQVDYDSILLEARTPLERIPAPESPGWIFRAISPGKGQIVLTSIVSCDQPQPCPLIPVQFTLFVEVR